MLKTLFNYVAVLPPATLLRKENLTEASSCKCCKIFQNSFLTDHLPVIAPASPNLSFSYSAFGVCFFSYPVTGNGLQI